MSKTAQEDMRSIYVLMVLLLIVLTISMMNGRNKTQTEPAIYISHDEALDMCDELGLVYKYESEGDTPSEFCYMTLAQAE